MPRRAFHPFMRRKQAEMNRQELNLRFPHSALPARAMKNGV
jgi:hypothetical protein